MYGIIPTAPPSDLSFGLSSREVAPHGDSRVTPFADQLAQLNSDRSDQQRHEAENAARRRTDSSDKKREVKDPQRAGSDAESESKKAASRETKDSDSAAESARTGTSGDSGEKTVENQKLTRRFNPKKAGGDGSSDQLEDSEKLRADDHDDLNPAKEAAAGEAPHVSKDATQKAAAARGVGTAQTAAGSIENRVATATPEKAAHNGKQALDSGTGVPAKGNGAKTESVAEGDDPTAAADDRVERPKSSTKDSAEGTPVEALMDRKEQSDAADRDRRVRGGQDPRERRIAAEKSGTRTVDAKAVAPVEGENATTERTVTREFSVDLSQATTHQSEGSQAGGDENFLAPGRMEVSLGDNASRTPSLSQATQTLARRLNGDLGDTIVRQAKVMLQDANNAELRLVIRPPELGRIRIRLQMENGHIAGRILVDNGSVREVVEQNLASLQRAFEEAGLEMGDLEVSTGDARDEADTNNQEHGGSAAQTTAGGAESFGRSIETISEYEPGRHRINLVA